jgi:hypothetical protein
MREPSGSICLGSRRGKNSTTDIFFPVFLRAFPTSRPSTPPPMRKTSSMPRAYSFMACASGRVLSVKTPSSFAPGIGGTKLWLPVARKSLS